MANLLEETKEAIASNGHNVEDVLWVGSADGKFAISWEEFEAIADFDYDSGYGCQEVARDLVVVFEEEWLAREYEDNGQERWELRSLPKISSNPQRISSIFGTETTLSQINKSLKPNT